MFNPLRFFKKQDTRPELFGFKLMVGANDKVPKNAILFVVHPERQDELKAKLREFFEKSKETM